MPGKMMHLTVGTAAGAAAILLTPQDNTNICGEYYLYGGLIGGFIGGLMPDIIDPPTGPNHRGMGHSMSGNTIGLSSLTLLIQKLDSWISDQIEKAEEVDNTILIAFFQALAGFVRGFIAGQASHLLLDLTTPKRLPW